MNAKKIQKSFGYALRGVEHVFKSEQNFRIQLMVGVMAVIAGLYFQISGIKFMFLASIITLVLILECINTAIERVADIVKPRLSEQVKVIKDIMAGAVLLASVLAIIIGICIFF